jgi:ribonuclease R
MARDVLAAAKQLPKKVVAKDIKGARTCARSPSSRSTARPAKDFDDAVYCERARQGLPLWVAIADVSHYVKPGDALDREAFNRGNSGVLPAARDPDAAEELSNELCSLKPDVDRLVMVCEMEVSGRRRVATTSSIPGVIHSHARLTYTRVAAVIEGREADPARAARAGAAHRATSTRVFKALLGRAREARRRSTSIPSETR